MFAVWMPRVIAALIRMPEFVKMKVEKLWEELFVIILMTSLLFRTAV